MLHKLSAFELRSHDCPENIFYHHLLSNWSLAGTLIIINFNTNIRKKNEHVKQIIFFTTNFAKPVGCFGPWKKRGETHHHDLMMPPD